MLNDVKYLAKRTYSAIRRQKLDRSTASVESEYSDGWNQYWEFLQRARSIEEWLLIKGFEDVEGYYNVDGQLSYQSFDYTGFYRTKVYKAVRDNFPTALSVTEYGCGVGRNVLWLKHRHPNLQVYGYELCAPGVEIARKAAEKFGVDVDYSKLDYLKDTQDKFVFPNTDVAFTNFSLEQLPRDSKQAVENILSHVNLGTVHLEPVPENYPWTYRGLVGRLEHWKIDYLSGFDRAVRSLPLKNVRIDPVHSAHNSLMFPSLYILRKA
jgi:hypothetical protein